MSSNRHIQIEPIETLTLLLKKLVDIESYSNNAHGNDQVIDLVASYLETIGMETTRIQHEHKRSQIGCMLSAVIEGKTHPEQFLTLLAHSDTVHAYDHFPGFSINDEKTLGFGPGVIDCKGGIVVAMAALKGFLSLGKPNFSVRLIISTTEETGSRDFHEHIEAYGKNTVAALGFEPSHPNGNVVHARSGNRWYKILCHGRKAHSGRAPKEGANAVTALAMKAAALEKLTDFSQNTTVCVTHIKGGLPNYNTIPESAELFIDTRFETLEEDQRLEKEISKLLKQVEVKALSDGFPCKIESIVTDYSPALMMSLKHRPVLSHYLQVISDIEGREIRAEASHGSADINSLWHPGMFFVGGAGAVGFGMHTPNETIELASLQTRALAAARTLAFADQHISEYIKL